MIRVYTFHRRRFSGSAPRRRALPAIGLLLTVPVLAPAATALGATYEIFPTGETTSCSEEFESLANTLQPGDELILHHGEYWQSCRRAIIVNGTAADPIVIRAADGAQPVITRADDDFDDNNIEVDGSHFTIRGLTFRGGSAGVRFLGGQHITFEDNEIFNTSNNAINMNSGSTDSFVIRNNHIHDTGIVGSDTEGEGMYVGCHSGSCVASNHLIEGNYIHHLRGSSSGGNDGIELKYRSHSNIVRGNLIHDTNIGTEYPCIFSYGGGTGAPNIIENNVVYNCGEAILVTADTIVRNNLVLSSSSHGIHSRTQSPSPTVRNLSIVNNTIYGSHPKCAQLRWSSASNVVFANNALYCAGSTAVEFSGLSNATVKSNYVVGGMSGASVDNDGFFDGGSALSNFTDPTADDFHLLVESVLIDAGFNGAADLPNTDHDGNVRVIGSAVDVGAFEFGLQDSDVDGVADASDNCTLTANPDQRDTDGDSIGNACDADLNGDCSVGFGDMAALKAAFTPAPYDPDADFNGDGFVNFGDLAFMKSTFFNAPSPGPGPGLPGNTCE